MKNTQYKLSNNLIRAIKSAEKDQVKDKWNAYFGYIRNLEALKKPYDLRHYQLTKKIYEEWKNERN